MSAVQCSAVQCISGQESYSINIPDVVSLMLDWTVLFCDVMFCFRRRRKVPEQAATVHKHYCGSVTGVSLRHNPGQRCLARPTCGDDGCWRLSKGGRATATTL